MLDFRRHAIDDQACHHSGCLKAECSHLLMMVTPLDDEPYGRLCSTCAVHARAVTRPQAVQ